MLAVRDCHKRRTTRRSVGQIMFNLSYLLYLSVLMDYPDLKAPDLHTGELICHQCRDAVSNDIATNVRRHCRNAMTTAVVR